MATSNMAAAKMASFCCLASMSDDIPEVAAMVEESETDYVALTNSLMTLETVIISCVLKRCLHCHFYNVQNFNMHPQMR